MPKNPNHPQLPFDPSPEQKEQQKLEAYRKEIGHITPRAAAIIRERLRRHLPKDTPSEFLDDLHRACFLVGLTAKKNDIAHGIGLVADQARSPSPQVSPFAIRTLEARIKARKKHMPKAIERFKK